MPRDEIEQRLGINRVRLTQDVHMARRVGLLPEFEPARPPEVNRSERMQKAIQQRGFAGGNIRQVYGALTLEAQDWLLRQVPEGSSVAEVVAAIITDAYLDEAQK